MPFGKQSFDTQNVGYLTSQQALADYAQFITELKQTLGHENMPVVAFGGSYGGMLSAWFRVKYPHVVNGAIAASAPIAQFTGLTPWTSFNQIITQDFAKAKPQCEEWIRKGFAQLNKMIAESSKYAQLSTVFKTCTPIKTVTDGNNLMNLINNAITYMAMLGN